MSKYMVIGLFFLLVIGTAACSPSAAPVAESPSEGPAVSSGNEPEHEDESDAMHEEAGHDEAHEEVEEAGHEHEEDEHREHGPHEHGTATLSIAWSGNDMEIDLDTPGFNLFGFEHAPTTDEETQAINTAVQDLESGALLRLNSEAACLVTDATTVTTMMSHEGEEDAEHDETDHGEEEEVHSDVEAQFSLSCESPEDIQSLDLSAFFERFPNFEVLNVQWVSDTGQSAAELTAESPTLSLLP